MYGKIFDSIYDGTLRANWKALVTFQQLIVLSDADGIVDMTQYALHGRTGIPLDIIEEGIQHLSQPDKNSRSKEEEGRRIILIDPNRPWGWKLVNHQHYKELRTAEDRREYMQQYMRDYRKNNPPNQGPSKQESLHDLTVSSGKPELAPLADTDTDTDTDTELTTLSGKPDVGHSEKKKTNKELRAEALEILSFLNEKAGRNFKSVDANIDLIVARLREGYSVTELRQIVAMKTREWINDEEMNEYLRPETLFGRRKCAQYSGKLGSKKEAK